MESPWLKRIEDLLADGRAMRWDQLIAETQQLVPAGRAYRRQKANLGFESRRARRSHRRNKPRPETYDPEHMVWVGQRILVRQTLLGMIRRGHARIFADETGARWVIGLPWQKREAAKQAAFAGRNQKPWTKHIFALLAHGPRAREELLHETMPLVPAARARMRTLNRRATQRLINARLGRPVSPHRYREGDDANIVRTGQRIVVSDAIAQLVHRGRLIRFERDGIVYIAKGRDRRLSGRGSKHAEDKIPVAASS